MVARDRVYKAAKLILAVVGVDFGVSTISVVVVTEAVAGAGGDGGASAFVVCMCVGDVNVWI